MQKPAKDTEKTKIGLGSKRRTKREMYPRNKAGENFNLENIRRGQRVHSGEGK